MRGVPEGDRPPLSQNVARNRLLPYGGIVGVPLWLGWHVVLPMMDEMDSRRLGATSRGLKTGHYVTVEHTLPEASAPLWSIREGLCS